MKARNPLLMLLVTLVLLALVLVLPGAASARGCTPQHYAASAIWEVTDVAFDTMKEVGGYTLATGTEYANWTGAFEGSSVEPWKGVFFPPFGDGGYLLLITSNFEGSVYATPGEPLGTGRALIVITARAAPGGDPSGTWTVARGSEGLRHLCGRGTWEATETGLLYTGEVWLH